VKRALRPVNTLSKSLAARSSESLTAIEKDKDLPIEVQPLVESLNQLLVRLDNTLRVQRVFVADAAHELRTPLTALKLQIQAARQHEGPVYDGVLLRKMEERVNRAIHLVQQLLALAREDTEASAREGKVDIQEVASRVIGDLFVLAEQKGIDLGLDCENASQGGGTVSVAGDEASLTTLVTNLIDNAIRYTEPGGRVDVLLAKHGNEVRLEVVDNGPGIPPDDLGRVLDRFYRASNSTGQGSGLGLAIAAKIAAKHRAGFTLLNRTDRTGLRVIVTGLRAA
jgi:two-component system, OmpR family, sensor kinase